MIKFIFAVFILGFVYVVWNVGILYGNVIIMAVGSYFTFVFFLAFVVVLFSVSLSFSFW